MTRPAPQLTAEQAQALADAEAPLYTPHSGWISLADAIGLEDVRKDALVCALWEQAAQYVDMVRDAGEELDQYEAEDETARRVAGAMYLLATGEQPPAA